LSSLLPTELLIIATLLEPNSY